MNRCPVSVFAAPYRPRKSTAESARAYGDMAGACGALLALIMLGTVVYFVGSLI